jgi:serine phosphatase RsbU (regulator of sigma subunit)
MKQEYKILFVEDVPADAELMERELLNARIDFISKRVDSKEHFIEALAGFLPDIIISDNSLRQFDSLSAMKIIKEEKHEIPFLLIASELSDEYVAEYLKGGAYDYVLKTNLRRLPFSVKNALSKCRLQREKQIIEFEKEQLQKSNQESVSKNKDITDSILYAKGIQSALLPKPNYIHQHFPESFLITLPKDIVSGDFYWFSEYKGKTIVAVGDCTGHGVPAALISMIGYNMLNYIVNMLDITNPAHILKRLNFEIQEAFNQDEKEATIRDGMDIAICVIDKNNNLLEFAGANRPLYYVKNGELQIIKGDKKCIGGIWEDDNKRFIKHSIPIDSINSIYLFTDGFLDQFGGKFGKKFLSRRFQNLLSSVNGHIMNEQKEILMNALNDWKGDEEQTDDICVLGLRF